MNKDEERSSLARRVLQDDLFMDYPTWFHEIPVGDGPVAQVSGMRAWMMLLTDNKVRSEYIPIVTKIDNLLTKQEICIDDLTNHFVREVPKEEVVESKVQLITYNLLNNDFSMVEDEKSKQQLQPIVKLLEDINIDRNLRKSDVGIRTQLLNYAQDYPERMDDIGPLLVKVPDYNKIESISDLSQICQVDKFHLQKVSGMRQMTGDFFMGRVPSNLMHVLTEFLDIRQVMMDYDSKVIMVRGTKLKNYMIDFLVRNGYYVVDFRYSRQSCLQNSHLRAGSYGLYGSLAPNIEYVLYINNRFYKGENLSPNMHKVPDRQDKRVQCVFFRTILFEGIDAGEYGLLPSAYPDQGQVICVYPPMCSFDKMSLAHRARDFMLCRYRHMNGDFIWVKQDEKAVRCGYKYRFVIPRYSAKLGQYYVSYQGLLDYYHHNPQRFIDELVMMDTVVRKLRQSPVPERELMDIFQFWGYQWAPSYVRLWYNCGFKFRYFLETLRNRGWVFSALVDSCQKRIEDERNGYELEGFDIGCCFDDV